MPTRGFRGARRDGHRLTPKRDGPPVSPPAESRLEERSPPRRAHAAPHFDGRRRSSCSSLAGVLIATFSDNPSHRSQNQRDVALQNQLSRRRDQAPRRRPEGRTDDRSPRRGWFGLTRHAETCGSHCPTAASSSAPTSKSGPGRTFPASGRPTSLVAGIRALWVAPAASRSLAQFNGDSGAQVHTARLPGNPLALALDQADSTAWVADSSGAISHVDVGPPGDRAGRAGHRDARA